jgi:hypothetical protein
MAAFDDWMQRAGGNVTPAQPIEDFVAKMKAAYPSGANQFGWYSNDAHYRADPPLDHTPYSADAWPNPNPRWWVFATDVMVTAVGGVDEAQNLFDYWLAEAKAGRAPWMKYMIWKATNYDVRNGWNDAPDDDHFDHIHISARTDYQHHSLGSWSVVPEEDDVSADDVIVGESQLYNQAAERSTPTGRNFANWAYKLQRDADGFDSTNNETLKARLDAIDATLAEIKAALAALRT